MSSATDGPRIVGDNEARWLSKFTQGQDDDCWRWSKPRQNGYGYFYINGREVTAHRVAFERAHGPIPDGLVIDHLCRNKACVNPNHLEAVTHGENVARGLSPRQLTERHRARTHCPSGHAYEEANTYRHPRGYRSCRACHRDRMRSARAKDPR